MNRQVLGARNIAQYLKKIMGWEPHIVTIYRWLNTGVLPGYRWGGRWAVQEDALRAFRPPRRGRPPKARTEQP